MRRRLLIVMCLAALVCSGLHAESGCSLGVTAGKASQLRTQLQAVRLAEDMQDTVDPNVRRDIHALKDALAAVTDARMACTHDDSQGADAVQGDLAAALQANQPPNNQVRADAPVYGSSLVVNVQRTATSPAMLLVQWGFGIECGDDNLLLAYAFRNGSWLLLMRWQSKDYDKISDAYGDSFAYTALPGPTPRLVVFHGTPWCTSRWSGFGLDVLEPGKSVDTPHVLFHHGDGYVRGDFETVLKPRPDGFELRVEVGMRDMDVMTRTGIFRYRIDGDRVTRVQPVAMNGRDFVDQWLQSKWPEASAWSDPAALPALEHAHQQLLALLDAKNDPASATFGPVRGCSDARDAYQVQLDLASGKSQDTTESRYFLIRSGANSFTLQAVLSTPSAQCKGGDLMKKG